MLFLHGLCLSLSFTTHKLNAAQCSTTKPTTSNMSHPEDGDMPLGGPVSVVAQLQHQNEELSSENFSVQVAIDALPARKRTGPREMEAKEAHSDILDELQKLQEENEELKKALRHKEKAPKHAEQDRDATTKALDNRLRQRSQGVYAEQLVEETRALRESLANEIAEEAYMLDTSDGKVKFIIPVRIRVEARDSQAVVESRKWREGSEAGAA
ncbi:uncharacterized protein M421DRAFT_96525 [Didymella exigua CBS 183.55]|uniref:Uncharacterized protein n=1 Tax=Didymella exigua CBS 183.55 TaxID=1150837 RepID=A0A6A5R5F3_9PLEO|nr:uncharacterized protein M421DRAFT_96525 [Didymella exigua CBS 183.55]KAF1922843.1 hypothetical protein M421DRAFT_96525 [Didymella exigua CBS 183.55]